MEDTQLSTSVPTDSKNRDTKQSISSALRNNLKSLHLVIKTCCRGLEAQQEMSFSSRDLRNEQKGCGCSEDASLMQRAVEVTV